MENKRKALKIPAGVQKMRKDELRSLSFAPIFIPERLGWYIAADIGCGLDLYRGGCGFASYADYDVQWTAYCYPAEGRAVGGTQYTAFVIDGAFVDVGDAGTDCVRFDFLNEDDVRLLMRLAILNGHDVVVREC